MKEIIKRVVEVAYKSREGHIPSSLSVLDLLYVLYEEKKEKIILSKGHASLGLYAIMEHFGLLEEDLNKFCEFDSLLGGHCTDKIKNVEISSGSLGHGLPMAVGMALSYKIQKINKKIYVIIGDGEANEGSIWESALLASQYNLDNLYCIMDYNLSGDRALKLDDIIKKFQSFNWDCRMIDGHNHEQIHQWINVESHIRPVFILANTIKGKGIPMMENNPEWHHKIPNDEEYLKILNEL